MTLSLFYSANKSKNSNNFLTQDGETFSVITRTTTNTAVPTATVTDE